MLAMVGCSDRGLSLTSENLPLDAAIKGNSLMALPWAALMYWSVTNVPLGPVRAYARPVVNPTQSQQLPQGYTL